MSERRATQRRKRTELARGCRDVVPIVLGAVPFGVLFGAVAAQVTFSATNTVLMSLIVYSGAIQLIGLNMIVAGTPWPLIAFASLIVNARHVFYSAALTPHVRRLPVRWRVLLSYGMTDQIFVLAERRYTAGDGSTEKHWYVLGSSAVLFVAWLGSTCIGFTFGDVLENFDGLDLDFAIHATLVALAAPSIGDARSVAVGLVAGLVALLLAPIPYQGGVLVAVVVGIVVGVLSERWLPRGSRGDRGGGAANDSPPSTSLRGG